jgi:hypothetical protein
MKTSDVPPEVFRKSIDQVNKHLREWPEDEWIAISEKFDLNLFMNGKGMKIATLYPVIDGKTVTNEPLQIWSQSEVEPRLAS